MKNLLLHEGFFGSVHFSPQDSCFFGKIEGIDDLVTFEGQTVKEITSVGKPMQKSYKGSFNVRISPELHKIAVQKSLMQGISLNQLVQNAIEDKIKDQPVE